MKIKILGLDCSPRKDSNSGQLLAKSLEIANAKLDGAIEMEIIHLRDHDIRHCRDQSCDPFRRGWIAHDGTDGMADLRRRGVELRL